MQHTLEQIAIHRAEKLFAHVWRAEKLISTSHIVCAISRGRQPVVKAKREKVWEANETRDQQINSMFSNNKSKAKRPKQKR